MSSVWRPVKNPPVLPKLNFSEEGQILFNYISRLYNHPVTTYFQSQTQRIKDEEAWYFVKSSNDFGDPYTQQNVLNRKEIKIDSEWIGENTTNSLTDKFNELDSIHHGESSVKSGTLTVPAKRRQTFQEMENISISKKFHSQMVSQDKINNENCFSAEQIEKIYHSSQGTFPYSQKNISSQIYSKGRGIL